MVVRLTAKSPAVATTKFVSSTVDRPVSEAVVGGEQNWRRRLMTEASDAARGMLLEGGLLVCFFDVKLGLHVVRL